MSINPLKVTNFDRTDDEMEEFFLFAVCVAGKTSSTVAKQLDVLLARMKTEVGDHSPFAMVNLYTQKDLASLLKDCGMGCYNQRAEGLTQTAGRWAADRLDLRTCDVADLEDIKWVGPKTARFFLLHSRKGIRAAAIDTHILKHLAAHGISVPSTTPGKGKTYLRLEQEFLALADLSGKSPADYDLEVWTSYSQKLVK